MKKTVKKQPTLPGASAAIGFRPEFLDFQRGIRVGRLEDHERITRILKLALETRFGQPFVTERYGRGMYWQWIGLLPRANRAAKPLSSHVSFGCSKYFLTVDGGAGVFKCGLQVERGYVRASGGAGQFRLQDDWDWHRLMNSLKPGSGMERELKRLLREGFRVAAGSWDAGARDFGQAEFPGAGGLRSVLDAAPKGQWAGFQVYYPMTEEEVRGATGCDLVESMLAVFGEVTPAMNFCMDIRL